MKKFVDRCARIFGPAGCLAGIVITLGVCGCSQPESSPVTLNLALKASPNKLDPALAVDVAGGEICSQLFEGLVRFSPDGDVVPCLAQTWEILDGGKRYVFRLDPRARFSTGRRVGAADVVQSFERVLGPKSASPRKWVLDRLRGAAAFADGREDSIAGLSAPDDSTVVLELDEAFRPFLSMLALPAAMVVAAGAPKPPEGQDRDAAGTAGPASKGIRAFEGVPVGSGPWRLDRWERGDYLTLVRNPYSPRAFGNVERIIYRIIPEAFTRIAEFESGALDVLEVPLAEQQRFSADARIQSRPELRVYYIGLNNAKDPFRDARVRRALNMAVDVDKLIEVLANGQAIPAGGAIPPGLAGYAQRRRYPYDADAARRLLAEAGFPEGFSMEIWQRESPEGSRILEAVQGYLGRVGVEAKLVRREWSAFKEAVSAGRVDAFFLDWFADYPDAENFLYPLFHSQNVGGGGNRSFFKDETIDRLIESANRSVGPSECARLYSQIDSLIYDQAPWIYLYFPRTLYVTANGISGYRLPSLYLGHDYASVSKNER